MTSTAYLTVTEGVRPGTDRDLHVDPSVHTVGASRPSVVRALLARSVTMTAEAIERRIRMRRRQPDPPAQDLSLARRRRRQAARARHETHLAEAAAARTLFSIR